MKNLLIILLILTACTKEPPVKTPIEEHWSDVRKMIKVDSTLLNQEQ